MDWNWPAFFIFFLSFCHLLKKTSEFSEMFWIFFLLQIWQILFKFRKNPKILKPQNEKQRKMQLDEKMKEFFNLLNSNYYVMVNLFQVALYSCKWR